MTIAPAYPWAQLVNDDGDPIYNEAGTHRIVVRTDPAKEHDRWAIAIFEIDVDWCANTFGVAPCTATGEPCYHGFTTCKDKPNFIRTSNTFRFGTRGFPSLPGQLIRPYITEISVASTEIQPLKGLAIRSQTMVTLCDEPDSDTELDPNRADRATPAQGTFWTRFQARHPNIVGRMARLRRGYFAVPWSEQHLKTELFVIEAVEGPDEQGRVRIKLTDVIKALDRVQLPAPTDGATQAELKASILAGRIEGATATTVTFPNGAPIDDGAIDGMEVEIVGNVGAGQRRLLSAYVGGTRTATVPAWSVIPDSNSFFEVHQLSLDVGPGKGAQYGASGWVALGDEVIQFTSRTGDVLSWPDGTHRAQFGTAIADHDADEAVQLCFVRVNEPAKNVVRDVLLAGVALGLIDVDGLAVIDATWWSSVGRITACRPAPLRASDQFAQLARDLNLFTWWSPVEQLVRFKVNLPEFGEQAATYTDDDLMLAKITRLDAERITRTAQYFGPRVATGDENKWRNFLFGRRAIDSDAESLNEYGDIRDDVRYSPWLSAANRLWVESMVARRVKQLRDAPVRIEGRLDPRADPRIGALIDIITKKQVDVAGVPRTTRMRLMKLTPTLENWQFAASTVGRSGVPGRGAYIAPNGFPNYDTATEEQRRYAFISDVDGLMSDGSSAYTII